MPMQHDSLAASPHERDTVLPATALCMPTCKKPHGSMRRRSHGAMREVGSTYGADSLRPLDPRGPRGCSGRQSSGRARL